jgi:hypothetical protein
MHQPYLDSATQTFGELFDDGSVIDLIRAENDSLQLISWDGSNSSISSEISENGKNFAPPTGLDKNLIRAMQFPTRARPYGLTEQVIKDLHDWFVQHPGLPEESVWMLVYFALATWFREIHRVLPSLFILAPDTSGADLLLSLLRCVCRRSLRVRELTEGGIFDLPFPLQPTLLIEQERPSSGMQRVLRAMNRPGVLIPRNGQYQNISCPFVLCSGEPLTDPGVPEGLQVMVMPTRQSLPNLPIEVADELQGKLLQYRMMNFKKVRESQFEAPELRPPMADMARTLGSCVVDYGESQRRVVQLLKPQDEGVRVPDSTKVIEIVIEGALCLCHKKNRESIYVAELAEVTNMILQGRKEIIQLEPRGVGDVLRALGPFTRRLGSAGRGLMLQSGVHAKSDGRHYSRAVSRGRSVCARPCNAHARRRKTTNPRKMLPEANQMTQQGQRPLIQHNFSAAC